jgi:spore coat polysaccharide biosynthesis predicted glycosyltransferase SpsG
MLVSEFHKHIAKHTLSFMRLIIRADASASVGTGHVMRSSTIAAEFLKLGHAVCYAGSIDPMSLILERFQELGIPYPVLDPVGFESNHESDILLIDSYSVKPSDPFIERERWFKLCSITDSATPKYNVDLSIKPSLYQQFELDKGFRTLSGTNYVLLRNSIVKTQPRDPNDSTPLRILIAGGGSDPSGFCNEVTKALRELPDDFTADIFSDNIDLAHQSDSRIRIHKVSLLLDEFAKTADLALTLASSLSIEFIAREIPVGIACAFENQRRGFNEMVSSEFAAPIGSRDNSGEWVIDLGMLKELIGSRFLRNNLRSKISGLIDMNGPKRVAQEILRG